MTFARTCGGLRWIGNAEMDAGSVRRGVIPGSAERLVMSRPFGLAVNNCRLRSGKPFDPMARHR